MGQADGLSDRDGAALLHEEVLDVIDVWNYDVIVRFMLGPELVKENFLGANFFHINYCLPLAALLSRYSRKIVCIKSP